jgi:predicted NBD/HSP70 family sugar kinase
MRRGTNLPAVGGFNQIVILDLIRRTPSGLSRVEIAEKTGLSQQTVSNVSRRLLDDGLIVEAGKQIQGPGKPRVILQLDPSSRYAVGVHLDPTVITYVILDLTGKVVVHERFRTPRRTDPGRIVESMAETVDRMIDAAGIDRSRVLGIGIASPGPIDSARGTVVDPPLLEHWRDVPLRDAIAEATGMPVILEKDVTAAVVAELWFDAEESAPDFAFFYLGTGIGVGIAIAGEAIRGISGNAGEGGTMVVAATGLPAHRRSEMLGHLATPQFLVAQAVEAGVLSTSPADNDLAAIDDSFTLLVELADSGDSGAEAILGRAAGFIASVLVTIVNLLDIDRIVFGGPAWARVSTRLLPAIARNVESSPERVTRHAVATANSSIGEDVAAVGAACLVLDTTLSPRASSLLIST